MINTSELYFEPVSVTDEKVVMRLNAGENSYIDFVYSVSPDSYVVKYDINQNNMAAVLNTSNSYINMFWEQKLRRQEKGKVFEERYSNLYYKFASDDVEYLDSGKDKSESVSNRVKWIGYKNQFFTSVLISKNGFIVGSFDRSEEHKS